jgi:sporulation-control protein spo0M
MTHDIGGLFGLGATKFSAEVVFPKNEFTSAEKLMLRVHVDNTECKKDVKEIKIKLERFYNI